MALNLPENLLTSYVHMGQFSYADVLSQQAIKIQLSKVSTRLKLDVRRSSFFVAIQIEKHCYVS